MERSVPGVYVCQLPPSKRYCSTSVIVPAPPAPAVAVAETSAPLQTDIVLGIFVSVPGVGCGFTVMVVVVLPDGGMEMLPFEILVIVSVVDPGLAKAAVLKVPVPAGDTVMIAGTLVAVLAPLSEYVIG